MNEWLKKTIRAAQDAVGHVDPGPEAHPGRRRRRRHRRRSSCSSRVSGAPTMVRLINTPIKSDDELRLITSRLDEEGIPFERRRGQHPLRQGREDRAPGQRHTPPRGPDPQGHRSLGRLRHRPLDGHRLRAQRQPAQGHHPGGDPAHRVPRRRRQGQRGHRDAGERALRRGPEAGHGQRHHLPQARLGHHHQPQEARGHPEDHQASPSRASRDENIVITDQNGIVLNDFAGLADFDRLEQTKREQKLIQQPGGLVPRHGAQGPPADLHRRPRPRPQHQDRHGHEQEERDHRGVLPLHAQAGQPDHALRRLGHPAVGHPLRPSKTTYEYQGTGFNPEGPAGIEGQTAPAYKDLQNMVGKATQTHDHRERGDQQAPDRRGSLPEHRPRDRLGEHRRSLEVEV